MTRISDFVQQTHNFIAPGENCRRTERGLPLGCSWQIAGDRLIDGPRPEDGTDFSSYAAGASPDIPEYDRSRVVVVGHADHARARADRSQRQAAMRFLRAVPRRADAAAPDHPPRG